MIPTITGRRRGVNDLAATAMNNAAKYILNTYLPTRFPGTDPIASFGGTSHDYIRHPGAAAFGLAACIDSGMYDSGATGVSIADATAQAVRVSTSLAAKHHSNGGDWGSGWQTALWAWLAGAAAWLTWDSATPTQQTQVTNMVVWEANRMISWTIPYWKNAAGGENHPGDTKREEIAWNAAILLLALSMVPDHANAASWWSKLTEAGIAQEAMPADLTDPTVVCGIQLSSLPGTNVTSQGGVINHGILHPDYLASTSMYGALSVAARDGIPIPHTVGYHAREVYECLSVVEFVTGQAIEGSPTVAAAPGGTIYQADGTTYYPNGTTWSTARVANMVAMDVLVSTHRWDTPDNPGTEWALASHLPRAVAQQDRFTTGQTYIDDAEGGFGTGFDAAEMWVAHQLAYTVLALAHGTPARSCTL